MFYCIVLLAIIGAVQSQMVRQCTCQEFEPCKNKATGNIMQCSDQCQSHLTAMGGSYPALRQCIQAKEPMIRGVVGCQSNELSGALGESPWRKFLSVITRNTENSRATRKSIQCLLDSEPDQVSLLTERNLLPAIEKCMTCIEKCMDRGTGGCFKKLNCGLALPPDNVLVQTAKQCAIRQGFNTPAIQQLCRCFANAGVRGLAPLCSRIQIS
ncbi:hypothetical protein OSTOST_07691 [Ostertagia ostertagi]